MAKTKILACHRTTAPIISFPMCCRFRTKAQPSDAVTAPMPKAKSYSPRPVESVSNTSRAKMGIRVV